MRIGTAYAYPGYCCFCSLPYNFTCVIVFILIFAIFCWQNAWQVNGKSLSKQETWSDSVREHDALIIVRLLSALQLILMPEWTVREHVDASQIP